MAPIRSRSRKVRIGEKMKINEYIKAFYEKKDLNAVLYSYGSNMVCPQMRSAEHQASIIKH